MNSRRKVNILRTALSMMLAVIALTVRAQEIKVVTPQGRTVEVKAINKNTLKVSNTVPGEQELTANHLDVAAVKTATQQKSIGDRVVSLSTGPVTAVIDKTTGALTIFGGDKRVLGDSGLRTISGNRRELELTTTSTGAYYGAGERGHKLNLRGDTLVMYNRPTYGYGGKDSRINQMNITMPLFISSDGWALVFDDYAAGEMILGDPIKYISESPGAVSYYFVNGVNTLADVVENLSALTGRQDLPPLWALGYITSKYGYRTQSETEGVIDTLKRMDYPVDGIVLDLYWYGKEQDMGRLDWEPSQWPEPKKMLSRLNDKGVKVIPISQPYVLRNGHGRENYDSLAAKGIFVADSSGRPLDVEIWVGNGGMFDVSNPATKDWLAKRYGELTDMGVGSWWGDLGEPEQHPESGRHANGLKAREYHNKYGNDWSKIIYDLFREKYSDRRLLSLMRGGTTGLQQYSVFSWSGDVARSWEGMEPQVRIMLNAGLSGLGYMSHDVGGFALSDEKPYDPELYVRWLQLGLFSPVLRTHSQADAEPYKYPQYADIIKKLIKERYSWLPYNYTLAYENATKGWPLVRPLNFHDEGPAGSDTIVDEFLWGRDVLVAPVLTEGAVSRPIIFPLGRWIDMSEPRVSYTGAINSYEAPLDKLPLFARAGAFIPRADYKMGNTGDFNPGRLSVDYYSYPGVNSKYTLFDDDRMTPDTLEKGRYRLIHFVGNCDADDNIKVKITSEGTYVGAPKVIDMDFCVQGLGHKPSEVLVNGKKTKVNYDEIKGVATVKIKFIPEQTTEISIINNK